MSDRRHPHLKSITTTPDGLQDAAQPVDSPAVGEPKGVAEGVPIAVRPHPHPSDGRYPVAWLTIRTPYQMTPSATSTCLCGRSRTAVGKPRVLALIADHEAHRDACPFRTPLEGRTAA
ncbi:hypothetical protein ABZ341_14690 [Streptomyces sp. NPDC006173]|uniref:hypothetical protein n=1 Tax=Streptomyces sp. NPDC006173 TaxID=3155349 RepID=UPI0033D0C72B